MRNMLLLAGLMFLFISSDVFSAPAYPLKTGPNNRYLVDQNDVPVFLHGDSPWFLVVSLTNADVTEYLADRAEKGFNAIIVDLIEDATYAPHSPENAYGEYPFTGYISGEEDFTTPNSAYFNRAKWVIQEAGRHGMQVFLFPAYLGGTDYDGWKAEININGASRCRTYGRYVGDLFKDCPNITWMMGGDTNPAPYMSNMLEILYGIQERDTTYNHLVTLHGGGDSRDLVEGASWLGFNSVYSYYPGDGSGDGPGQVYLACKGEYDKSPVMVTYLFESFYEVTHGTGKATRMQSYWGVLTCIAGEFYGSVWTLPSNWRDYLDTEGAIGEAHLQKLIDSREWWKLVPDQGVLSSGQSSGNTYVTAARTSDGGTVIAYIPDGHAITVNMSKVGGSTKCWWYNPRTGGTSLIGEYANTGTRTFTAADSNDWVLVLDNASRGFPAPGIAGAPSNASPAAGITSPTNGAAYTAPAS